MKKIFSLILTVVASVLFASCGKGTAIAPKTTGISFTAELEFFENKYVAAVTVKSDGNAEVQITSPDTLKGLEFVFSGKAVTAKYLGLEYKYNIGKQPSVAAVSYLYEILKDISEKERQITLEDGRFYTDGRTENTECISVLRDCPFRQATKIIILLLHLKM